MENFDFVALFKQILTYFWEVFKFWKLIPEDVATKIESEANKDAE